MNEMKTTVGTLDCASHNTSVQTLKAPLKHTRNRPEIMLGLQKQMLLLEVQSDNIYHKAKFSHTLVQTFKNH